MTELVVALTTVPADFFEKCAAFWAARDTVNPASVGVAAFALAVILMLRRYAPRAPGLLLAVVGAAKAWLLKEGYDQVYGARPLRRAIQRHIEDALSEAFIRGRVRADTPIEAEYLRHGGILPYMLREILTAA